MTLSTMLATAGMSQRVSQSHMRHCDGTGDKGQVN